MTIKNKIILVAVFCFSSAVWRQHSLDLVLQGGRVIDPETSFDAIANVGINGGKIVALLNGLLLIGPTIICVSGKVIAPGFID
jgi:predicted amidohydrolase